MEEVKTLEDENEKAYHSDSIIVKNKKESENKNYYKESMDALIEYMENHEKNPNEKQWDKFAICRKYLSSKTIGYLSGIGFNTLCRNIRKQINKKKRQMKK